MLLKDLFLNRQAFPPEIQALIPEEDLANTLEQLRKIKKEWEEYLDLTPENAEAKGYIVKDTSGKDFVIVSSSKQTLENSKERLVEVSETSTSRSGSRFRGTIKFTYTPTNPSTPLIEYIEGIHRISPLTTSQDKQNYRLKPLNRSYPPFTNPYIDNLVSNVTVYKYNDREGVEWNIIDGESANKGVLIIKMPFGDKAGIAMQWSAGSGKGIVNLWKIKHKDKITVKDLNLRQASIIGPKEYGYFDGRNGSVGIVESATHRYRGEMTPSFVYNGQGRMEDPNAGAVFEGRYEHGVAVSGRIYQQDKQIIELKGRRSPIQSLSSAEQ